MRAHAPTRAPSVTDPAGIRSTGLGGWVREHLPGITLVALAGAGVAAFFLFLYWVKQYPMPIGGDTPRYLDQASLVAAHRLAGVPEELPPPLKTLPSRGGFQTGRAHV